MSEVPTMLTVLWDSLYTEMLLCRNGGSIKDSRWSRPDAGLASSWPDDTLLRGMFSFTLPLALHKWLKMPTRDEAYSTALAKSTWDTDLSNQMVLDDVPAIKLKIDFLPGFSFISYFTRRQPADGSMEKETE